MSDFIDNFNLNMTIDFLTNNVDAVIIVDGDSNQYKSLKRKGIFSSFIDDEGKYHDLIKKLWYHFEKSADDVVEQYHVFIPKSGLYSEKYSQRVQIVLDKVLHNIQMTIYPIEPNHKYVIILDELDSGLKIDTELTDKKVSTIQNTYLFSMYIDIVTDSVNSISVSEISGKIIHQQIKYTDWRMMIVNMFDDEEKKNFLKRSDPEYLKQNVAPGETMSYDCEMMNLEGEFIWVKLIFSRTETSNPNDYRFVFVVQDIQETIQKMNKAVKKYEKQASEDPLTSIYNHRRIETEMRNAIDGRKDRMASFMILDIDHFKKVNDCFGHHTGDVTLIHFVDTISKYVKDNNTVVGRWGGEEFVVVMYDLDEQGAKQLAETVRQGVETEMFESVGNITCSIGLTEVRTDDELKTAFQRMDEALYVAKKRGRNNIVIG